METTSSDNIQKANSTMAFLRRNLNNYPEQCKKCLYITFAIYSGLQCYNLGPILYSRHIKLERTQRQAARFITGDYKSREEGCVTKMIHDLGLEYLQERRSFNRLVFFYKVVEGLVPPIPPDRYVRNANIEPNIYKLCYI